MKLTLQQVRRISFISLLSFAICGLPCLASAQSDQQQTFPSAWQAAHALVTAVKSDNEAELLHLFGPDGKTLCS